MTRVFLLHASGDPDWPEPELNALAAQLEAQGFEVLIDTRAPAEVLHGGGDIDWMDWMAESLKTAAHWVVLDSQEYARRARRPPDAQQPGRGVAFEFTRLRRLLYNAPNRGRVLRLAKGEPTQLDELDGIVRRFQAPAEVPKLVEALVALCQGAQAKARDAQHSAERAYLQHWLDGELADHPARAIALAGQQQTLSPLRHIRQLPFNPDLLLQHTDAQGHTHSQTFGDARAALQAARPSQPLLVLGEPGAGKSFTLECRFIDLAEACRSDPTAPLPLLLRLGEWLDPAQPLEAFIEAHWKAIVGASAAEHLAAARAQRRVVLLLDALNEIPSEQRNTKAAQVAATLRHFGPGGVWAGAVLSCRERDATGPLNLPCDRLTLQPLRPAQVFDFLRRWQAMLAQKQGLAPSEAEARAESHFWQLAAGSEGAPAARALCAKWATLGVPFDRFWSEPDIPRKDPDVYGKTSGAEDQLWRRLQSPRSLLHLAANPFWLTLLAYQLELGALPGTRLALIDLFLRVAHGRACSKLGSASEKTSAPALDEWQNTLSELADALQGGPEPVGERTDSATRLPRERWPVSLTPTVLEFSVSAQVLREQGGLLGFAHQLLQEALAAQRLLGAWARGESAAVFWPRAGWWLPNGWDVAADLALESLQAHAEQANTFLAWLAEAQPDWASAVALRAGLAPEGATPTATAAVAGNPHQALAQAVARHWPLNIETCPARDPAERAALGRAWGRLGLDTRPGVGLRPDGVPDLQWVVFDDPLPFAYQGEPHPPLPRFALARYPVTHAQYQAFVNDGGYADERWWQGLADRPSLAPSLWSEPNSPRETVSWFEAVAYCRWLSHRLALPAGQICRLPTEQEWERAASGITGRPYPWAGKGYGVGLANGDERGLSEGRYLARTSAVGLYPESPEGLFDLAGNVWEWCLNEYDTPAKTGVAGKARRVLRGGSWYYPPQDLRASFRSQYRPGGWLDNVGFRVCLSAPIRTAESPAR